MPDNDILRIISVRDVLNSIGIETEGNRIPCPIHGGSNPTSFLFDEKGFTCFACGEKGGLIHLTELLYHCSAREAWQHLCRLAGQDPGTSSAPHSPNRGRRRMRRLPRLPEDDRFDELSERLEWADLTARALEVKLRIIRRNKTQGAMALPDFYRQEQDCLYQLEELDAERAIIRHDLNKTRKERNKRWAKSTRSN